MKILKMICKINLILLSLHVFIVFMIGMICGIIFGFKSRVPPFMVGWINIFLIHLSTLSLFVIAYYKEIFDRIYNIEDNKLVKIHELENGEFVMEIDTGKYTELKKITKENFEILKNNIF
jgi:hypothetical protein